MKEVLQGLDRLQVDGTILTVSVESWLYVINNEKLELPGTTVKNDSGTVEPQQDFLEETEKETNQKCMFYDMKQDI